MDDSNDSSPIYALNQQRRFIIDEIERLKRDLVAIERAVEILSAQKPSGNSGDDSRKP